MTDARTEEITRKTLASFEACPDPRLREVMQSLVRHLHAFVLEVGVSSAEWSLAMQSLTATGAISGPTRNEFVLWSDALGVSMLVDAVAHPKPSNATESTVVGPFHAPGSPEREYGATTLETTTDGVPTWYEGRVRSTDGTPIAHAELDVWQNDVDELYAAQDHSTAPVSHLRGRFRTQHDGSYAFLGVRPTPYTIPIDGPAGAMLEATGRHNWRPGHIHVIVSAPGFDEVVTQIFDSESQWLDSDAVFAVKQSLVREFVPHAADDPETPQGVTVAWCSCKCDFVLVPATQTS